MTNDSGGDTINQGGVSKPTQEGRVEEFDERDEEPSPGTQEGAESTSADTGGAVDVDSAHDRAS